MIKESNTKQPDAVPEDDTVPSLSEETVSPDAAHDVLPRGSNLSRLFWGLLLIIIGCLFLANGLGAVAVRWANLWQLWPLLIIAAGLSVLSLRHWLGRVLGLVLVVVMLGAVVFVAVGNYPDLSSLHSSKTTIPLLAGDIKQVEVTVTANTSKLRLDTLNQDAVANMQLESNVMSVTHNSSQEGDTQYVTLATIGTAHWWIGNVQSIWQVDLTRRLPVRLTVDASASDAVVDMSQAQLRSLNVKSGASNLTVRLGDRESVATVTIDSGASSILVQVPATSGVQLKLDSSLTTQKLADLRQVNNNTYESPNYAEATKTINLSAKIGVASLVIERY